DVLQQGAELRVRRRIQATVLFEAVPGPCLELIEGPSGPSHADDGHVEMAAPDQRLQGREELLERQVAGSAEEDERIRTGGSHQAPLFSGGHFYSWPPDSSRNADVTSSARINAVGDPWIGWRSADGSHSADTD